MGEFGWAYISGSAPIQSAGGVSGSVQFKDTGGAINGSNRLRYKNEEHTLELTGTLKVEGGITASSYEIKNVTELNAAGSSKFGNSSDDKHIITGSTHVEGSIGVTGSLAATAFIGDGSKLTNLPSGVITSFSNSQANRVVTAAGVGALDAEADLLFYGGGLHVTGAVYAQSLLSASILQGKAGDIIGLNATNISAGTLDNARLPSTISATNFNGDGGGLNNLNASNIAAGTLNKDRLPSEVSVATVTGSTGLSGSVIFGKTGKFSRDLTVEGTLTAFRMNVKANGDTIIGDNDTDEHQFTGSVHFKGPVSASTGLSASLLIGDGSQIVNLPPYGTPAIATYNTPGLNRIITSVNSDTVQAESDLTYGGGALMVTGAVYAVNLMSASILEGRGHDLENLNATNISDGTLDNARLPTSINVATIATADGSGISQLNATNISAGTLDNARLPADVSVTTITGSTMKLSGVPNGETASNKFLALDASNNVILTSSAGGVGGGIGAAEDGDYTDGLFTDFTSGTTVGTAVDKFNEVLKILAPSPAPSVQSANATTANGISAKLSFGASAPVGGIASSDTTAGFTAVDRNSIYQSATNGNNIRKGIYNNADITGIINFDIPASVTNGNYAYREDSFGNGDTGTLKLELNGSPLHTIDLSTFTGAGTPPNGTDDTGINGNGSGFLDVSIAANTLDGNGANWGSIFKYRSAKYIVKAADQRSGWNYLRIVHTVGSTNAASNYIEWINDPSPPAMKSFIGRIENINLVGSKYLSGVKYNTDANAKYKVDVTNAYSNVFAGSGNPVSFTVSNSTVPSSQAVPDLVGAEDNTKTLSITASLDVNTNRLLNGSITCNVSVTHPLKSNINNTSSATLPGLLIDNRNLASDNDTENFHDETFRKISASYDTQASVISPSADWNSQTHMLTDAGFDDGLLMYDQALRSPKQGANSGNFAGLNAGPAGNPNYSGVSGERTFYRVLTASTGQARDVRVTTSQVGTIFNNSSLGTGNMHMFVKIPGATGWMDATQNFVYGQIGDYNGALNPTATNTATVRYLTFGTASVANNDHIMFKFIADSNWTGRLSSIEFDPNISNATDADGLSTIDVDNSGINARLSFGSSNTISGYSNVLGSGLGSMSTINSNGAYTSTGNRKGIFSSTPTITGDINGNSGQFKKAYQGSLILEVNGVEVHSVDLHTLDSIPAGAGYDQNGNNSGFDLAAVAFRQGPANANDYRFPYRTGKYQVGTGDQRLGWNYVRVLHNEDKRPMQTIVVTVVGGIYHFDGVQNTTLSLKVGNTYRFDTSDSSNGSHPLRFSTTPNAAPGSAAYTTGVTSGAGYIQIIPQAAVTLYPYCNSHSGMGGSTQLNITTAQINETSYGEWVIDTDNTTMAASSDALANFDNDIKYYQSGIGYFAQRPSASYTFEVENVYRNVYHNGSTGITFPTTTNCSITNIKAEGTGVNTIDVAAASNALPTLNNSTNCEQQLLRITGNVFYDDLLSIVEPAGGLGLFNEYGISVNSLIKHPIKSNLTTTAQNKNYFMYYSGSVAGTTNLNTREDFGTELYRLVSDSYANQGSTILAANKWNSNTAMNAGGNHDDGLATVNGYLLSPLKLGDNGDLRNVSDGGTLQAPSGNPDYSSLTTANRTFYRVFRNQSGTSTATPTITLYGDANLVAKSGAFYLGALGNNKNINVEFKVPNDPSFTGLDDASTAWGDCVKPYSNGTQPTSDGVGIYSGGGASLNQTVGGSGRAIALQLQEKMVRNNQYLVVRITAHKDWTGYLSRIDITY